MKQAISNTNRNYPTLRVAEQSTTNHFSHLVNTAWTFASTALWNTTVFSETEIQRAKALIAEYLNNDATDNAFLVFCQRVLLARHYITSQPGRYIPLPSVWLDQNNKLGFAGTGAWYERITAIREAVPGYKTGIKAFAQALLELSNQPSSAAHYNYWKNYFIDHQSPGLLSLFQATVIQQFYNSPSTKNQH